MVQSIVACSEKKETNAKSRLGVAGGSGTNGKYLTKAFGNGRRKVGTGQEIGSPRGERNNKSVNGRSKRLGVNLIGFGQF